MFADSAKIYIRSGKGGDGHVSFRRELYVAAGGPDGGDGDRGGDLVFEVDPGINTLNDFRHVRKYCAGDGQPGSKKRCHGADGADLVVKVPEGTVVREAETGKVIADLSYGCKREVILKGGRGGKGNMHYATPTMQVPKYAQPGRPGRELYVILELKTIADVGLVGFPNVGKSTFLSRVSNAKPKIANYHFTTLSPNLGVVKYYDNSFVAADIPGLIEGASDGAGLGHDFLRHIERTRMLVHVVDVSGTEGRDPVEDFKKINAELSGYSKKLAALPQIIALNKCDVYGAEENFKIFKKKYCRRYKIFTITAVNGEGTEELVAGVFEKLKTLPPVSRVESDETFTYRKSGNLDFEIYLDGGVYVVVGSLVDMLCRNVVLSDPDSMAYFQKILREKGVISKLKEMGIKENYTVSIGEVEFDFIP